MWEILGGLVFLGSLVFWALSALFGMMAIAEYAPNIGKGILIIFGIIVIIGAIAENYPRFKKD